MKRISGIIILILPLLLIAGCYKDNAEDLYGLEDQCAEDPAQQYSWSQDVAPVIETNCAISGCHAAGNGGGRVELVSYDKVAGAIENNSLRQRVASGSMPPGGSLAPCDEQALLTWIDQNYPNN